jgi:hypothetical protein
MLKKNPSIPPIPPLEKSSGDLLLVNLVNLSPSLAYEFSLVKRFIKVTSLVESSMEGKLLPLPVLKEAQLSSQERLV